MRAVAYVRTRKIEPIASEQAISLQREAVIAWINDTAENVVITTYIEDESQITSRPKLKTAVEVCRRQNATLLVASSDSIGSGGSFRLPILDIPVLVLSPL